MKRAWFLTTAACVVLILGIILAFGPGVPPAAGATESRPGVRANAAACSVSGSVSADTTWSPAGCDPYIVSGSVVVPTGVTLTIAPGTTVKFDSLKGLLVQGTLVARGTAGNPITFTSNQGTPAKGDWNSIHFTDSSTDATFDGSGSYVGGSIIQYAVIEYAGSPGATGTLYIEASSPYIDHNTIRNNGAKGINAAGNGALRVNNNTITGNTTSYSDGGGGGIYVNQGAVTINNNTITGNTALASGNAGGTFAIGTVTITNNTITGNTASGICGGIFASGTGTITNNTITSNTASNSGGGICASFTGTITNNTITSNTATYGGGIFANGTVTITNNTITSNTATYGGGGGIYASGTGTISSNTITGNTALASGGGGGIYASGTGTISNNTITGNTATTANLGGGIYVGPEAASPIINNNDLYSNMSGSPAIPNDLYNRNAAGAADVNAENNYWGTTDPSIIEAHVWHFLDDSSLGLVDYNPFLTTPVGPNPTPSPTATPTMTPTSTPTSSPTPSPTVTPTPPPTPTPTPSIPNLSITKLASKDKAFPGDTFSYLIFLENSGPDAMSLVLTDTIPTGASYITNTVWGGATYSPTINSITWSGTVSSAASTLPSQVFQFRVKVDDAVSAKAITNTVQVSDGSSTVAATARTDIWRRGFLPLTLKNSSGW